MKKILLLVVITLFAAVAANAQDGWITYKADAMVSVKFPAQPKEVSKGSYGASTDSTAAFVITVIDFKDFGVDSATLKPMQNTQEFTSQLKTGLKQSMTDVDLEDIKIGTWKGLSSYTTSGTDSKRKKYDMFMFIIGTKMYSLSSVRSYGTGTKGRDDFFASVELTH